MTQPQAVNMNLRLCNFTSVLAAGVQYNLKAALGYEPRLQSVPVALAPF